MVWGVVERCRWHHVVLWLKWTTVSYISKMGGHSKRTVQQKQPHRQWKEYTADRHRHHDTVFRYTRCFSSPPSENFLEQSRRARLEALSQPFKGFLRIFMLFRAEKRAQDEPNLVLRLTPLTATIGSRILRFCTSDSTPIDLDSVIALHPEPSFGNPALSDWSVPG